MIIDEYKQYGLFKLEKRRKTYLEHNEQNTEHGYKRYKNKLTQKQICEIIKKDTNQESYDKWSEEVQNMKEVENIFRQNPRKDIIKLIRRRKKLRTQYQNTEIA